MALQPIESLAPQQRRTLELLAEGLGNVQIAQRNRTSLDSVTGMLEELYTALGIESGLSKQEKRTTAINHFKKNSGTPPMFEQKAPAALLEGFKPWQRKALNLIAQEKSAEEVSTEVGLPASTVEETLAQFMRTANVPTREKAIVALKQVISAISQPAAPDRGYTNGHDKAGTTTVVRAKSETSPPVAPAQEKPAESVESVQEKAPVSAATASAVSTAPVQQPVIPTQTAVQSPVESQTRTEKPMSPLAAAATREKSMLSPDKSAASSAASKTVATLPDRVKAYMEQHKLSVKQFAERCGSSIATIYAVQKDEKVRDATIKRIEAVLVGKSFSANDVGDEKTFDPTSEKLITMVSDLAAGQNELDELVRLVFNRWAKVKGADDSKAFAVDILRQYLATETDEARLETLLELRDIMKPDAKKPAT